MMDILDGQIQRTFDGSYLHYALNLVLTNDTCMSIDFLQDPLTRNVLEDKISTIEETPSYPGKHVAIFESLHASNLKLLHSILLAAKLELKPLSKHLK